MGGNSGPLLCLRHSSYVVHSSGRCVSFVFGFGLIPLVLSGLFVLVGALGRVYSRYWFILLAVFTFSVRHGSCFILSLQFGHEPGALLFISRYCGGCGALFEISMYSSVKSMISGESVEFPRF